MLQSLRYQRAQPSAITTTREGELNTSECTDRRDRRTNETILHPEDQSMFCQMQPLATHISLYHY